MLDGVVFFLFLALICMTFMSEIRNNETEKIEIVA